MSRDTIYGYYRAVIQKSDRLPPKLRKLFKPVKMDQVKQEVYGIVCIRLDRPPKEQGGVGVFKASFSFCSPEDTKHFSRKKARMIADSRMTTTRVNCVVHYDNTLPEPNLHKTFMTILELAFKDPRELTPHWFEHSRVDVLKFAA